MTTNTKRAIQKYGHDKCVEAFKEHHFGGNGANTIGWEMGLTTRQADAAINAGREIYEANKK